MPELPEVETTVHALRPSLIGRTLIGVWNDWSPHLVALDVAELGWRVNGRTIQASQRRGKYLLFPLSSGDTLIIHLKMSGHLSVVLPETPRHPHVHTIFTLDNGQEWRFRDQRKFGKVYLVADPAQIVGRLGPEPLAPDFTVEILRQRLSHHRRALKPLLLDQAVIAGIGNIYADESLFYAHLHPQRPANTLHEAELWALHAAIQQALNLGIAREGASIDLYRKPDGTRGDMQNAVKVFRRTGDPCYDCGTPIKRMVLGGRSTHFCPTCQPEK